MKLLDTNVCAAFLNGSDHRLRDRLLGEEREAIALCSVVKADLFCRARSSRQVARNLERVAAFCAAFESLPFDDAAAEIYGLVRAQLGREGRAEPRREMRPLGAHDVLIAATALAADATLVARNRIEFRRVPGLRIESW